MIDLPDNIVVYEYQEAEQLIRELAEKYKEDVTMISRGGRGRAKAEYYNFPCSFDIETSTIRSGQLDYHHPDGRPVAFPYLFQWNIYGSVIFCRQYEEAMQIFSWLGQYFIGTESRKLVLFDHNLSYEYGFFKDLWKLDYKNCFVMDEHRPVTLSLENGLIIRDSYKMTNMSLETLTKDWSSQWFKKPEIMDYQKLRTPYSELDPDTILYSALDVLSLSDAMQHFLEAHDTGVWTRSPTSTSFIRADLKKRIGLGVKRRSREQRHYFRILQRCKVTPDIYDMLIRQSRGGNTHANRAITGQLIGDEEKGSGVVHFDITSSYPTQMVCYPEYPIGAWSELRPDTPIETIMDFEEAGYCCLFDVVLIDPQIKPDVPVPYIPVSKSRTLKGFSEYSDNGRYLRGAAQLRITLFGCEWPIIESQYDYTDVIVLRGYYARKGYLPDIIRKFVIELYARKTQLKSVEGQEVEYMLAKTYVNGVYGMCYTKIIRDRYDIDERGIFLKDPPEEDRELARYQASASYFLCYAWGAMVSTQGRIYLQRMIDSVGPDAFLYCDTDSIFARYPERSRARIRSLEAELKSFQRRCGIELTYYDIKGRPHELGGIDEEPECAFKTFGAKKYITIEGGTLKSTIAGVPKKEGAAIIGSADNFRLDMVFPGSVTGKNCLWYNDNEGLILHDELGREIPVYSNVAMLPVDYRLGLSDEYRLCLEVEGINELYSYQVTNNDMVEEFVN